MKEKILDRYDISANKIRGEVKIILSDNEFVPIYTFKTPAIEKGTLALLDKIKERVIAEVPVKTTELADPTSLEMRRKKFYTKAFDLLDKELPDLDTDKKQFLAGMLVNEMVGLGKLEIFLSDTNLEEIVVNNSEEPVWVYHRKHGWLKTNITIDSEAQIQNYSSSIGRKVGRQITTLDPLLDANLITGDRVNATLFPISTKGNTITIRMFRRKPWTITDFVNNKTIDVNIAALLWLAIQYEMNIIVSGGTGSGKTSLLNVLAPFMPPNQRIISIEDTREIKLPRFLHWIPMTTREPSPEGKGEISMLDLLVNSLRMRPDRIIVAEIRRQRQAEVLFEAMHTGHSVYSTLHADTSEQTYRRLVNPPIDVPETLMEALDLLVVMFRDRRTGIRRIYEISEIVAPIDPNKKGVPIRILYRWDVRTDKIKKCKKSKTFMKRLKMHTGMTNQQIKKNLEEKKQILNWLIKKNVNTVDGVGKIIAEYYRNPKRVLNIVRKNGKVELIVPKELLKG